MHGRLRVILVALPALVAACSGRQESGSTPPASKTGQSTLDAKGIHEKSVHSVAGVRASTALGERSGTGIVLSSDGLILTSYTVCPAEATGIRVWLKGPRRYDGSIVGTDARYDMTLIRIKCGEELKPISLGRSSGVRVGQLSYTIGNLEHSIIRNDEAALSSGRISGAYRVKERRAGSSYVGPVLETSAAIGVGMEGAPCLDAEGLVIGVLTTNYSPSRFLGVAIPVDEIKPAIERLSSLHRAKER